MPEYLTPGVYFEPRDQSPGRARPRTDVAGFVGLAERGPLGRPVRVESWRQFQARFGAFVPHGFLAYAVKGFFENGGRTCFVVRAAGRTAARASLTLRQAPLVAGAGGDPMAAVHAADEGTWGNAVTIGLSLVRRRDKAFSLVVSRGGDRESFPELSLEVGSPRYFVRMINEGNERAAPSSWVRVTDLIPAAVPRTAAMLPDPVASGLGRGPAFLTGGRDGIASLTIADLLGDPEPLVRGEHKQGLSALERVDEAAIIAMPDIHIRPAPVSPRAPVPPPPVDPCRLGARPSAAATPPPEVPPEQPPSFAPDEVAHAQRSLIEHCERLGDRVAVLDAALEGTGQTRSTASILEWRRQLESARGFAGLYYPWVGVVDPLRLGGRAVRHVPPSGHVAGLYARFDRQTGVHRAPANGELFWAEDVTRELDDGEQGVLNPEGVNCLRAFPGRGIRVYGARTISSDPDWRYVNVRRLLSMIEEAVDESTHWAVFEPHDFNLRQTLALGVSGFLETLWREGALVGATAAEAYYVKCDQTNNPARGVDEGRVVVEVGVAPTVPAEFIVFRIGRTLQELGRVES